MRMIDPMIAELEHEAETTRRVLERIPEDRLGWRPPSQVHVAGTARAAHRHDAGRGGAGGRGGQHGAAPVRATGAEEPAGGARRADAVGGCRAGVSPWTR